MKLTTIALGVIAGSALAYNAYSLTCAQQPTCDSLGYTLTSTTDCIGTVLKCPFNTARYYCTTKTEALNKLQQDIVTAAMPDYSKRFRIDGTGTRTASTNGYLIGVDYQGGTGGCDVYVFVDSVLVRLDDQQAEFTRNSWTYPIKKGSTYRVSVARNCSAISFFVPTI